MASGERTSLVICRSTGLPLAEVSLFIRSAHRNRGNAAETIHMVARSLAFLHSFFGAKGIDFNAMLRARDFLSVMQLHEIAEKVQHRMDELVIERPECSASRSKVVSLEKVRMQANRKNEAPVIKRATIARRMRYMAAYLEFCVDCACHGIKKDIANDLKTVATSRIKMFLALKPKERRRTTLGARAGIDRFAERTLLDAIDIESTTNPWKSDYVRRRNRLIVLMYLHLGIRRGELLGIQIKDLATTTSSVRIVRRADAQLDPRRHQPNTKTYDREIEISPGLMAEIREYIKDRHAIKLARKHPYLIVSENGSPLSLDSVNKLFNDLRHACPGLPKNLTPHVLRHTWNDRFSEAAEEMGLSHSVEEKARATQQGWSEGSAMAATYTRRFTKRKGREVELRLQALLEEAVHGR